MLQARWCLHRVGAGDGSDISEVLVPGFNRIEGQEDKGFRADLPKAMGLSTPSPGRGRRKTHRFDRREVLVALEVVRKELAVGQRSVTGREYLVPVSCHKNRVLELCRK
jgi:hypothetical protein